VLHIVFTIVLASCYYPVLDLRAGVEHHWLLYPTHEKKQYFFAYPFSRL